MIRMSIRKIVFRASIINNKYSFRSFSDNINKPSQGHGTESVSSNGANSGSKATAQTRLGSYIGATYHTVEALEESLMARIHASNKKRFRIIFATSVASLGIFILFFGSNIASTVRGLTKGLLHDTLEDKTIKIQTQELAVAVVQTVLTDKDVANQAVAFLREASQTKETQDALLKLALHIIQHPDSMVELTKLTKKVIEILADDKVIIIIYVCITLFIVFIIALCVILL